MRFLLDNELKLLPDENKYGRVDRDFHLFACYYECTALQRQSMIIYKDYSRLFNRSTQFYEYLVSCLPLILGDPEFLYVLDVCPLTLLSG